MIFTISTTGNHYSNLEDINKLEDIGFTFKKLDNNRFKIEGRPKVEINTLDELIQFSIKHGELILLENHIQILDDYL